MSLNPFTHGYAVALTATVSKAPADLSSSALERIVRDCGEFQRLKSVKSPPLSGAAFFAGRQNGTWPSLFPPLTLSMDDAGKVTLADRVAS